MRERNLNIELLKFLAVVLVANSHMGLLYGKYSFLATGGAIGDALFFFVSGFTLFLSKSGGEILVIGINEGFLAFIPVFLLGL